MFDQKTLDQLVQALTARIIPHIPNGDASGSGPPESVSVVKRLLTIREKRLFIRDSPKIREYYTVATCCMGLAYVLSVLGVLTLNRHALQVHEELGARQMDEQLSIAEGGIRARLEGLMSLGKALAWSTEFRYPTDEALDSSRLGFVDEQQVNRLATYDGVDTWLSDSLGPSLALRERRTQSRHKTLRMWQLTRGLPLRNAREELMARTRRRLVDDVLTPSAAIQSIGELDSMGRVVFLVPYKQQLQLKAFDFSDWALTPAIKSDRINIVAHDSLVASLTAPVLSLVTPIQRLSGRAYLLVTIPQSLPASRGELENAPSFGMTDQAGHFLMYAGNQPPRNTSLARRRSLTVNGTPYTLLIKPPASQMASVLLIDNSIWMAVGIFVALVCFNLVLRTTLLWSVRYSWKLSHVKAHTKLMTQELAHDYSRRLLALRTLMTSISGKLNLDQLKRLYGAITDLTAYTEQLSLTLVDDAFELLSVPDAVPVSARRFCTYLSRLLKKILGEGS